MPKTRTTRSTATVAACLAVALSMGCLSTVDISSDPPGAFVKIDGVEVGKTPLTAEVAWHSGRHNEIMLSHPGYYTLRADLRRTVRWPETDGGYMGPFLASVYTFGLITFAYVGPIKKQHFVLAPLPSEQDKGATPSEVVHEGRSEGETPGGGEVPPAPPRRPSPKAE